MTPALGWRGTKAAGAGSRAATLHGAGPPELVRFMERGSVRTEGVLLRCSVAWIACLDRTGWNHIHWSQGTPSDSREQQTSSEDYRRGRAGIA